jgi:hypothetical protein
MTLRSGSTKQIQDMFGRMSRERTRIIKSIVQLVYFMRGSIQYNDMMNMSFVEREIISNFIEERLENESKKMYPCY